jgi:hypothetical protein
MIEGNQTADETNETLMKECINMQKLIGMKIITALLDPLVVYM